MITYKEVFIDFECNNVTKPEEINFTKGADFKTRQSLISPDSHPRPRGFIISLPNYIIFG
jgi:hypothetical protein